MNFLIACLLLASPLAAQDDLPGWERAFDEGAHVRKLGRPILVEPVERDIQDLEKRLQGQWRHQSDGKIRDAYYGPVKPETGRGEFFAVDSDDQGRHEMALVYSVDLDKSSRRQSIVRYYPDFDSPVPIFKEFVRFSKNADTITRFTFREPQKKTSFDYVGSNVKPGTKAPRGYVRKPLFADKAEGLYKKLIESAERLTKANRVLRKINEDYIAARWRPEERARHARHLRRFTEGELKRSRAGFKKSYRDYSKVYGTSKAKAALKENGFGALVE